MQPAHGAVARGGKVGGGGHAPAGDGHTGEEDVPQGRPLRTSRQGT